MSLVWFLAGIILGWFHITTQRWTVNRLQPDRVGQARLYTTGGFLLRLLLAAGLFLIVLPQGLGPALWVLGGLWLSRWGLLWWLAYRD